MLWLWILLGAVALVVVLGAFGYNRLVRLRNEADTGWSNIDVQLQRRGDLIPNLIEARKGSNEAAAMMQRSRRDPNDPSRRTDLLTNP